MGIPLQAKDMHEKVSRVETIFRWGFMESTFSKVSADSRTISNNRADFSKLRWGPISRLSGNEAAPAIGSRKCLRPVHVWIHEQLASIPVPKSQAPILLPHAHSNSKVAADGTCVRGFRKRAFSAMSWDLLLPRSASVSRSNEVLSGFVH